MRSISELVEELSQLFTRGQVLTDIEDRYVYSFENIYTKPVHPMFDIVVRDDQFTASARLLDWGKRNNITIYRKNTSDSFLFRDPSKISILLDNTEIPEISGGSERPRKIKALIERKIQNYTHSVQNNIASAVQILISESSLTRCLQNNVSGSYCTITRSHKGIETWSAKGRMLLIRGLMKGDLEVSKKFIDVLYTCSECGNCFSECAKQSDFHKAIIHVRNTIAKQKLAPDIFHTTAFNISRTGDPAATSSEKRFAWLNNITNKNFSENPDILYWVGCMVSSRTPKTALAFYNILKEVQANFTMLGEDEGCCGYVLISSGLWNEAKIIAKDIIRKIEKTGVDKVITPCAGCFYTFTKLFPEIFNLYIPCEVLHSTQYIKNEVKTKELRFNPLNARITYHDPCSLGRHCGVYDTPREILEAIPDLQLAEMTFNRSHSRCCGGGGGLWSFNYQTSMDIASNRLRDDVTPLNIDMLTTSCPLCQMNFRITAKRKSIPLKVNDITEIVGSVLKTTPEKL
ncbi:MAG: (Fe-S)-binding protein [Candidatus Hodarchaeales archaeon]|jgi:Fe-S oxidoreductase